MRVCVLGPIEVDSGDGTLRPISAHKERTVLAALCARPNEVVTADALIDAVWGDRPPATARKTLQTYVLHLRRLVGDRLQHRPPGYVLVVDDHELDALAFERAASNGRHALLRGDGAASVSLLAEALDLWRGDAFLGTPLAGESGAAIRLHRLREVVEVDLFEARLLAGEAHALVPELDAIVSADPLHERVWALLIEALDRAGRRADALRTYQRARAALIDEVGLEPGPELRAAELAVLARADAVRPQAPDIGYVTNDDGLQIAYAVHGAGPRDVVFCAEWTMSLGLVTEIPEVWRVLERLADDARLIMIQRRGSALSDRESRFAPPEQCLGDVDAVLRHVACERASFVGWGHGGQIALAYAATSPERVRDLALINAYLRLEASEDHPDGVPSEVSEAFLSMMQGMWGTPQPKLGIFPPELATDPEVIARVTRIERLTASPREAVATQRAVVGFDVRSMAPSVVCPTLIVHLSDSLTGRANSVALRSALTSADDVEFVELPGWFVPSADHADEVADAIGDFQRRTRDAPDRRPVNARRR